MHTRDARRRCSPCVFELVQSEPGEDVGNPNLQKGGPRLAQKLSCARLPGSTNTNARLSTRCAPACKRRTIFWVAPPRLGPMLTNARHARSAPNISAWGARLGRGQHPARSCQTSPDVGPFRGHIGRERPTMVAIGLKLVEINLSPCSRNCPTSEQP